jgi:hypothetical protein
MHGRKLAGQLRKPRENSNAGKKGESLAQNLYGAVEDSTHVQGA